MIEAIYSPWVNWPFVFVAVSVVLWAAWKAVRDEEL